jgi:hypothetical protein
MPGYVKNALVRFQYSDPYRPDYATHQWTAPVFGSRKPQLATPTDTADLLPPNDVTVVQQIVGTFLFYARAVDQTMLVALGSIASQQTKATQNTAKAIQKFFNYAATRNVPMGTQRCVLSLRTTGAKPSRRPFLPQHHAEGPPQRPATLGSTTTQQWSRAHSVQHFKKCHGLSSKSGAGWPLLQRY